jgi:MoaA/NifB/PqqE/SkfB family radical SAM enzyme
MTGPLKKFETGLAYHFSELLEQPLAKPLWIYISLSHKCTYHCQMCGVVDILQGHELHKDAVKKLFDEIAAWGPGPTIVLTGGEVFLRGDVFEIIAYGAEKGLTIEAVSNGSLITKDLADKIIASGLSNIAVSLDGAREATHDAIRQPGAYRKAVTALKHLSGSKRGRGRGPQISTWVTIMRENVQELYDIIPVVKDAGAECLVYHPVIVNQEDMQNTSPQARFWLKENDIAVLKGQIDRIVAYKDRHGMVAVLHDPYMWIKHFRGELTKSEWKCNPFVFLNVGPDGDVRSCGAAFGNIKDLSLDECLRTKEADACRRTMMNCRKPCLQTCWADPDSDNLGNIVDAFIGGVGKSTLDKKSKRELLRRASRVLADYEDKVKECAR